MELKDFIGRYKVAIIVCLVTFVLVTAVTVAYRLGGEKLCANSDGQVMRDASGKVFCMVSLCDQAKKYCLDNGEEIYNVADNGLSMG